jgi:hypothetical protein
VSTMPLQLFSTLVHHAGWSAPEHAAALPVFAYWKESSQELLLPFQTQLALDAGADGLSDMHSKTPLLLSLTGVQLPDPPSMQK